MKIAPYRGGHFFLGDDSVFWCRDMGCDFALHHDSRSAECVRRGRGTIAIPVRVRRWQFWRPTVGEAIRRLLTLRATPISAELEEARAIVASQDEVDRIVAGL